MEFVNHTPFPALAFEGIDQHEQAFHVVVLRQTLTWDAHGKLHYANEQSPLCEEDTYFGAINRSAVRQESDLCQYKPRCDVIVNATAHAPGGNAAYRFEVRLLVKRPDTPVPLPREPQGLNPYMPIDFAEKRAWQKALSESKRQRLPGKILIDKTLVVTGERHFVRHSWPFRLLATFSRWGSLGIVRPNTWRLTTPRPVNTVPLNNEFAFGGQCRINAGDKAARRVARKHRLQPETQANHPDAAGPAELRPIAHDAFAANPIGRGYARRWFIEASGCKRLPAPQMENPHHPIRIGDFSKAMNGKFANGAGSHLLAGLGIRPKGHPERARLLGTIDDTFIKSDAWLPEDFDFAIWNAAWPDQQVDELQGDEVIELSNLCAPETLGAQRDAQGNTTLNLVLPGDECQLLVRLETGEMFQHPMRLDTLLIEPEERTCHLVWRATLAKADEVALRAVETWLMGDKERATARHEIERIKALMSGQSPEKSCREGLLDG
jgi:hypothetical protein